MHWLYYSEQSPSILEKAGYSYDATLGFNDAVGFRNGTTQAFRPAGARTLLELPLNVQDTAMLFPRRMHLSEPEALSLCERVMAVVSRFGGALTINWHDRSLAPERNWNDLYAALLTRLRRAGAWFATASQAVDWFRCRRSVRFAEVQWTINQVRVTIRHVPSAAAGVPPLELRVHGPDASVVGVPIHADGEYAIDLGR
jgi:hypothetical protein